MKRLMTLFLLVTLSFSVYASEDMALEEATIDVSDNESLERGAKHFVTYCLGCHSLKHIRYQRMALDFGIDEKKLLQDVAAPTGVNVYNQLYTAMNAHDAEKWFGIQPPDLSLISRSRGANWLYTYLKGFYEDKGKPLGTNNIVFKDVGMPNVFWQLQGTQKPVFEVREDGQQTIEKLLLAEPGKLSPEEFDQLVNDLVNFLVYVGEPVQLERKSLGKYVLLFLLIFTVIAYKLKKEYWKDIH